MDSHTFRRRFIDFFAKKHGHAEISSASLVPENDPTVLFTTAGMHPLVPYLMGETHPAGRRLVDSQKCLRTDDIDEVGDTTHLTFFEMLGNWSLGDYFKKESIAWSYEFLTAPVAVGGIGLDPDRLHVTCFEGDADAPRDEEAAGHWEVLGFTRMEKATADSRRLVFFYEKKKNWWGPAGQTGPCGPDTEIFYDRFPELPWGEHRPGATRAAIERCPLTPPPSQGGTSLGTKRSAVPLSTMLNIKLDDEVKNTVEYPAFPETMPTPLRSVAAKQKMNAVVTLCHPNCECGRYVEIWNNVFMQYNKNADGTFSPLTQQNVDTGLGFERVLAILQGVETPFETDLFVPLMTKLVELAKKPLSDFSEDEKLSSRIVSDHLRAATFVLADPRAVRPSNTDQGYVLRRLIRRAVRHGMKLGIQGFFTVALADTIIAKYKDVYPELARSFDFIRAELQKEEDKFHSTLGQGEREFAKIVEKLRAEGSTLLSGETVFHLYDTYGFPLEMTKDLAKENDLTVDAEGYEKCFKAHQEKSRAGASQKFHGGLADSHEETVKLHTATHLLHQALRDVLGSHVYQQGSNITQERLRFDFTHPQKMTPEQVAEAEARVNEAIAADVPVHYEMMAVEDAKKRGAIGLFPDRYDERIKVYVMDKFSTEICGGPHVAHTGVLGHFKIKKEESCAAGVRRIKAVVSEGEHNIAFAQEKA